MENINRNKIYLAGIFLLIFIILNPLFLEKFTTDGQINSDNLLIIINILSYSNLIIFLLIVLKSDFLIKVKKNIKNLIIFLSILFFLFINFLGHNHHTLLQEHLPHHNYHRNRFHSNATYHKRLYLFHYQLYFVLNIRQALCLHYHREHPYFA